MQNNIVIVRKNKINKNIDYDIKRYCGRGSILGNEFTFMQKSQFETSQVKDRDEACDKMGLQFLRYLMDDKNLFPKSQKVKSPLIEISTVQEIS